MIQISLTAATILYGAIVSTAVLIVWLYTEARAQHRRDVLEKQNLWKCSICGFSYLDNSGAPITQCPRCNSFTMADEKEWERLHERRALTAKAPAETAPPRRNPSKKKRAR